MELNIEQQIAILELAMKRIKTAKSPGLCNAIRSASLDLLPESTPVVPLYQLIPLFTSRNAENFGADITRVYWWNENKYRIQYLEWMISELKKQL